MARRKKRCAAGAAAGPPLKACSGQILLFCCAWVTKKTFDTAFSDHRVKSLVTSSGLRPSRQHRRLLEAEIETTPFCSFNIKAAKGRCQDKMWKKRPGYDRDKRLYSGAQAFFVSTAEKSMGANR